MLPASVTKALPAVKWTTQGAVEVGVWSDEHLRAELRVESFREYWRAELTMNTQAAESGINLRVWVRAPTARKAVDDVLTVAETWSMGVLSSVLGQMRRASP